MNNAYNLQPTLPKEAEPIIKKFYNELRKTSIISNIEEKIDTIKSSKNFNELSNEDQLSTKLFFQVIVDTIRQGWEIKYNGEFLEAVPPDQANKKNKDFPEIKKG